MAVSYPATFSVDYPDRKLNRLTTFFRIFMIIPIYIILILLVGFPFVWQSGGWNYQIFGMGIIFLPTLLMILFRQKYPRWWFDWNVAFYKFSARISAYFALLRDEYPSTDEEQAVHLGIEYPDVKNDLKRWMPIVKWILAIPHYIVLFCLTIAAWIVIIIAWFAILFTGIYPKGMFDFVVGVWRWSFRVYAYALLLVTDKYPPFSLDA